MGVGQESHRRRDGLGHQNESLSNLRARHAKHLPQTQHQSVLHVWWFARTNTTVYHLCVYDAQNGTRSKVGARVVDGWCSVV